MKSLRIGKVLLYLLLVLLVVILAGLSFLFIKFPAVAEAPDIKVEITPERIERGKYLANHVNLCMDCHSIREWDKFAGPPKQGTMGLGGEHFNHEMGFPGDIVSPNITPFRLASWTDGEIYRAITSGVSKDGRALFPVMPYPHYGKMDKEDVYSLIAYIKTLDPIESPEVTTTLDFPLNLIVRTMPMEAEHSEMPSKTDKVAYGGYMVNAAGCYDCHTKQVKGEFIGKDFAGGMEFQMGNGRLLRSANITPHPKTGIGSMSEEQFIDKFAAYRNNYSPASITMDEYQTVMPWLMYSGIKDEDLSAMYAYLMSQEAVDNPIVKYEKK